MNSTQPPSDKASFGAGCFWGTEKYLRHSFTRKFPTLGRIVGGKVGFMGKVEVFDLEYEGGLAYFEELVKYFFQFHDPTTINRQENDIGEEYASVIFCSTDEQFELATKLKNQLQHLLNTGRLNPYEKKIITTEIRRRASFHPSGAGHQDYLNKNPTGYCAHRLRFQAWPEEA